MGGIGGSVRCASVLALALGLSGCGVAVVTAPSPAPVEQPTEWAMTPEQAARSFERVVQAVEPVAEEECRRRTVGANCDFRIGVDTRPYVPANAYQTVDDAGRPVVIFTIALIASVQNADELAFVMGHESAHHIAGHLDRQRINAEAGAVIFGELASLTGGGARDVATAQELGAEIGARTYSKEFELEADELGTIITYHAGFDPMLGAAFFARIPDPGDQFLGSHPPNAARLEAVARTMRGLKG